MENKTISIIIPAFNSGEHLEACLRSVRLQTWADWEILLFDAGSTDDTAAIGRRWAELDKRIRFRSMDCVGTEALRNEGIRRAGGAYLLFLDADDYLAPDALESIAERIKAYQPDILIFSHRNIRMDGTVRRTERNAFFRTLTPHGIRRDALGLLKPSLRDACFRAAFLRETGVQFGHAFYGELPLFAALFSRAERISGADILPYCHRETRQSEPAWSFYRFPEAAASVDMMNRRFWEEGIWEAYWRPLYLLSLQALRFLLTRAGRFPQEPTLEIAETAKKLQRDFERVLKKWYAEKLDVFLYKRTFLCAGSAALPEMVRTTSLDGQTDIQDFSGRSLMDLAAHFQDRPVPEENYLVADLVEDMRQCLLEEQPLENRLSVIGAWLAKNRKRWKGVVLVSNLLCERHGNCLDSQTPFANQEAIRSANRILSLAYCSLAQEIPGCIQVNPSAYAEFRFSDDRNEFGCSPFNFSRPYIASAGLDVNIALFHAFGASATERAERSSVPTMERFRVGFNILNQWLEKKQRNQSLLDFFHANCIKTIAIYGLGALGQRLYDELEGSDVSVAYAIDRAAGERRWKGVTVIRPEAESYPDADAIIVTPVQDYWQIVRQAGRRTRIPLVSLKDVIIYEQAP